MVVSSSGLVNMKDFINVSSLTSCLVIWNAMKENKLSYRETTLNLLQIKGVASNLISEYERWINDEVSEIFALIAGVLNEKIYGKDKNKDTEPVKINKISTIAI